MAPVLVVDDSEAIRLVVREFLANEGYRMLEAGDGVVALATLPGSPHPSLGCYWVQGTLCAGSTLAAISSSMIRDARYRAAGQIQAIARWIDQGAKNN